MVLSPDRDRLTSCASEIRSEEDSRTDILVVGEPQHASAIDPTALERADTTYEVHTAESRDDVNKITGGVEIDIAIVDGAAADVPALCEDLRAATPAALVLGLIVPETGCDLSQSSIDEVLVKPISKTDLEDAVRRLLRRTAYYQVVQERLAITSKLATLETIKSFEELEDGDQYAILLEELAAVEIQCAELFADFDERDFAVLFREIDV